MLLAIGNAGGNILETIRKETNHTVLKDARYIFADCNENDLKKHEANNCCQILLNSDNYEFPESIFHGIRQLVIIVGLGGNTGTKFTERIVRTAKNCNIRNIFVVLTIPFLFEGEKRIQRAISIVKKIQEIPGIHVTVQENEKLFEKYESLNFFDAFDAVDKDILKLIDQEMKDNEDFSSLYLYRTKESNHVRPKLYVFSTIERFRRDIQEKVKTFMSDTAEVEIFLFKSNYPRYSSYTSRSLTLHLQVPVKIEVVGNSFTPPLIGNEDIIIDAISHDPDLQPLKGGFKALEVFISKQHATFLTF